VQTIGSKRITVFDGDYRVDLEYNKDFVILHLPHVHKFSKQMFQDMQFKLDDWYQFFKTAGYDAIYAAVDPDNLRIAKLLLRLDFIYQGKADGLHVYKYGGY
jgi:hypothetical protein